MFYDCTKLKIINFGDNFITSDLEDVTYTHFGGDNVEYRAEKPCSADGEPEKIWITIREDEKQKIIGLINLCGIQDDHWNTGKSKPIPRKDISLHVLVGQEPSAVWFASPDSNSGIPVKLKHTISAHPIRTAAFMPGRSGRGSRHLLKGINLSPMNTVSITGTSERISDDASG